MITMRVTEAEFARDVRAVLDKIQTGSEVIIENADHSAMAVIRKPKTAGRDIDECIRIAKAREALGVAVAPDPDFAADVAAAVAAHREPLEVPEWD